MATLSDPPADYQWVKYFSIGMGEDTWALADADQRPYPLSVGCKDGAWYVVFLGISRWTPMPAVSTLEEAQATALALWRMR